MALLRFLHRTASSYWLGLVTLFLLLVLTYLGTVEQIEHGLFATQQKYFNSLWLIHDFRFGEAIRIPVPLPGVYLLLIVFAINLIFGAVLRFRRNWSHAGVFVVHVGILLILLGGLITFKWSTDGHLTLYEGEGSSQFESYYDWEIVIAEMGTGGAELVIPGASFNILTGSKEKTFKSASLPFSVSLGNFMVNSEPAKTATNSAFQVTELKPELENERNAAAVRATVTNDAGPIANLSLWGMSRNPTTFQVGDAMWGVQLQRRRWQLPFSVTLEKFTRELHPGTSMAASFSSDVMVTDATATQKIHISMNKPLRYKGYTLFQASWGPQNAREGEPLFSSFAVVRNPADQFPLYGFIVITIGLMAHFCYHLLRYLRSEAGRAS